jgi:chemotaxis protein CheD
MAYLLVKTGQLTLGAENDIIEALGIGSCVVVCLYDDSKRIGGMAHLVLPKAPLAETLSSDVINTDVETIPEAQFVDTGIVKLLQQLEIHGSTPTELTAKIVGGSDMFANLHFGKESLGTLNVRAAEKDLAELGIKVSAQDVGGNFGRSVKFFLNDGTLEVRKKI